jgi:hypothetical protein
VGDETLLLGPVDVTRDGVGVERRRSMLKPLPGSRTSPTRRPMPNATVDTASK